VRWQVPDPADFHWAHLDGESVLFHAPSGKTHLLDANTVFLLTEVLVTARSAEEILQCFDAPASPAEAEELRSLVLDSLPHLEELALIQRC
jgi:PqqD family protein of HPr-rel-A system